MSGMFAGPAEKSEVEELRSEVQDLKKQVKKLKRLINNMYAVGAV